MSRSAKAILDPKSATLAEVYSVILAKFDKDAVYRQDKHGMHAYCSDYGLIRFKDGNADRFITCGVFRKDNEKHHPWIDGDWYVHVDMGIWGRSSMILKTVLECLGGGYLTEDTSVDDSDYWVSPVPGEKPASREIHIAKSELDRKMGGTVIIEDPYGANATLEAAIRKNLHILRGPAMFPREYMNGVLAAYSQLLQSFGFTESQQTDILSAK